MGNERKETERDFFLFLNTWEWLQNYWEWHWKHSGKKKNHPSTHPNSNWLHHSFALCQPRQGCFLSLCMGWLLSPARQTWARNWDLEEAAALPRLASPHVPGCPTQQHSSLSLPPSPGDSDTPAAHCQQAAGHSRRGRRCVSSRSHGRMDTHCSELQRMCLLGATLADVKGFSISLTVLNSQHYHNNLANFRRNLFKMWE